MLPKSPRIGFCESLGVHRQKWEEADGGKFDFQDCGSRHPGFRDLSDPKAQREGGAGISDKPGGPFAGAVLDGSLYI